MNRIRELRKARNMTMKDLAKVLGCAESTVSQYETGKRQPDNETLLELGEFFDVPVGYILGAESETKNALTSQSERKISDEDIMFALWGDASDMDKADLEDVKRYAAFVRERKNKQ